MELAIEKRINGKDKAPFFRCRGCREAYWAGYSHCVKCHQTFETDPKAWHFVDGGCIPPSRMSLEKRDGVWQER